MSKIATRFVERYLAGEAFINDIDDDVDLWHAGEGDPGASLAEFLGFNDLEYRLWAEKPHLLRVILQARKRGVPLRDAREDEDELTRWLKTTGEFRV